MLTVISRALLISSKPGLSKDEHATGVFDGNSSVFQCHQNFTMLTSCPQPQPPSVLVKQMQLLAGGKSGTGSSRVNQLPSWEQNPRILFPPHIQLLGVVHLAFSLFLVSPCIFFFLLNKQACLIQDSQDVRAPSSHGSSNS